MNRYDLDFSRPSTRPGLIPLALLLAGIAAVAVTLTDSSSLEARRDEQAGTIARLEDAERSASRPRTEAREKLKLDAGEASQAKILASLNYSWQTAFAALDAAKNRKVALVSLDAAQAKREVRVVAETRKLSDALDYIAKLNEQAGVRRAVLLQHETREDDQYKPVRFTVVLELSA